MSRSSPTPYITFVWGDVVFDGFSKRVQQDITIFGFILCKDREIIAEQRSRFLVSVWENLKTSGTQIVFVNGSFSNLFKPFGLDAGIFFPYAGFRLECRVPIVLENK